MKRLGLFILAVGTASATGCCAVDKFANCGKCDDSPCLAASNELACSCVDTECVGPTEQYLGTPQPAAAAPFSKEEKTSEPLDLQEVPEESTPDIAPPPPGSESGGPVNFSPIPKRPAPTQPVVRLMPPVPVNHAAHAALVQEQMQQLPNRKPVLIPIGHKISSLID